MAEEMKTLIRYRASRLDEIIGICAANSVYSELDFLRQLAEIDGEPSEITERWNECVNAQRTLTAEARNQLLALGGQLGRSDIEGQLGCLSLFSARIEQQLSEAETDYSGRRNVFRSLGIYGGIAAAIIIL